MIPTCHLRWKQIGRGVDDYEGVTLEQLWVSAPDPLQALTLSERELIARFEFEWRAIQTVTYDAPYRAAQRLT